MSQENNVSSLEKINNFIKKKDGMASALGVEIIELSSEHAVASMALTPNHLNAIGYGHGGAIFSLADIVFAAHAYMEDSCFVNAQSSISYVHPAKKSPLYATSRKIRVGKNLGTYMVQVTDADNILVATATITGYRLNISIEKALEVG